MSDDDDDLNSDQVNKKIKKLFKNDNNDKKEVFHSIFEINTQIITKS